MSYSIKLYKQVKKFLEKLPEEQRERIKDKFCLLKNDPFHYLESFSGADCYKLRIGNYRALIDVDFEKRILWARYLNHRSKVYKR